MKIEEFIETLRKFPGDSYLRFSVAIDEKEDPEERWFVENGIEDCFESAPGEVTVCIVGVSNYE